MKQIHAPGKRPGRDRVALEGCFLFFGFERNVMAAGSAEDKIGK